VAESAEHSALVRCVQEWIVSIYSKGCWGICLLTDLPESRERPRFLGGFRPDVWAVDIPQTFTVVGEAKLALDVENAHTEAQLAAYLRYLGAQPKPMLVLAVPWPARPSAVLTVETLVSRTMTNHVARVFLAGGTVLRMPK